MCGHSCSRAGTQEDPALPQGQELLRGGIYSEPIPPRPGSCRQPNLGSILERGSRLLSRKWSWRVRIPSYLPRTSPARVAAASPARAAPAQADRSSAAVPRVSLAASIGDAALAVPASARPGPAPPTSRLLPRAVHG